MRAWLLAFLFLALLSSSAFAARVVLSAGSIEIEVIDWSVNLYVVRQNANGQTERIPDFRFLYEPKYVGEYDDFDSQVGVDTTPPSRPLYVNITIPNDETVYDRSYQIQLTNGSVSNVVERTVRLWNGANFTQIVETFTRDSYKPLYGWRVPVGPETMKITARFTNWPYNDTYRPSQMSVAKYIETRSAVIAVNTRVEMLFKPEATGFALRPDSDWPLYFYERVSDLTDPVDPAVIPDKIISQSLLAFRDRRFDLEMFLIKNSSACNFPEVDCIWEKLRRSRVNLGNSASYGEIANATLFPDEPFRYNLPLFMGIGLWNKSIVEWDPNVQLLFGSSDQVAPASAPVLPGDSVFANSGTNAAVIGGSIAAAAVVVVLALVAYFRGRRVMRIRSHARLSAAVDNLRGDEERKRASTITPDTAPVEAPSSGTPDVVEQKRWTAVSRGRALTNVDEL